MKVLFGLLFLKQKFGMVTRMVFLDLLYVWPIYEEVGPTKYHSLWKVRWIASSLSWANATSALDFINTITLFGTWILTSLDFGLGFSNPFLFPIDLFNNHSLIFPTFLHASSSLFICHYLHTNCSYSLM